jgi:hypothetical protein
VADWTAITGIVVSGAIGPALGALYASRRLEREHDFGRVAADRAEARELLDAAAQSLQRAGRLQGALDSLFVWHGTHLAERATEHVEGLREAVRAADIDSGRLELRLGTQSDVVTAHRDAVEALTNTVGAVFRDRDLGDQAHLGETRDSLQSCRAAFVSADRRFMDAAHAVAASRLEAGRRSIGQRL